MTRRLIVLAGTVLAAIVSAGVGAAVAHATPSCDLGYSWSGYYRTAIPSAMSANDIVQGASTPSGYGTGGYYAHVAGYISVGSTNSGSLWLQTGILEGNGGTPRFYIEEGGATNPPGSPWVEEIPGVYIYSFGDPALGTAYAFEIDKLDAHDTDNFEVAAPGYTSPVLTYPSSGAQLNFSEFTSEVLANSTTCPTSEFEFTSPSPKNFGSYTYSDSGVDPSYFDEWLNSLTDWVAEFPTCDPVQCEAPVQFGGQPTPPTVYTAPPPVPPTTG